MVTQLRIERRDPVGWTLAEGSNGIGWIVPGRLSFTGFPDASAAAAAAEIAAGVVDQWAQGRTPAPRPEDTLVALSRDGLGFECRVPEQTWYANLLELAQRIHTSTNSLRHPKPEPAA
jgi:hypothetical protein